jgi:hypothetical protein
MGGTDEEPGVIPSAIDRVFDGIDEDKEREFLLRVSYVEASLIPSFLSGMLLRHTEALLTHLTSLCHTHSSTTSSCETS